MASVVRKVISSFLGRKRGVTIAPYLSASPGMPPLDYGEHITSDSAMKITAFYAGIRLISENIASLPKAIRYMTDKGPANMPSHSAYRVLNIRPNQYTNPFDFWSCVVTWLEGWGNAYARIDFNPDGSPAEIHQIHPSCVEVKLFGGKKWYNVSGCGPDKDFLNGTYPDSRMLHFMLLTLDGLVGVNPVIYNAMALGKSVATERFASDFYRKGGNIKAVLETEGDLGKEAYERFMERFQKSATNHSVPLLEYGIKYRQLSVNPVAAQLIQSQTMSIQDIARILGLPPHMIAELSHATFSNIEHQTIQFEQYTLRPIAKRIEVECEGKLFFESEQGKYDVKFILDGLLRGDTAARSNFYHNAILDGYMSRNEVRELEGLEHREGLDDMLYPLNTGVVGKENEKEKENGKNSIQDTAKRDKEAR